MRNNITSFYHIKIDRKTLNCNDKASIILLMLACRKLDIKVSFYKDERYLVVVIDKDIRFNNVHNILLSSVFSIKELKNSYACDLEGFKKVNSHSALCESKDNYLTIKKLCEQLKDEGYLALTYNLHLINKGKIYFTLDLDKQRLVKNMGFSNGHEMKYSSRFANELN